MLAMILPISVRLLCTSVRLVFISFWLDRSQARRQEKWYQARRQEILVPIMKAEETSTLNFGNSALALNALPSPRLPMLGFASVSEQPFLVLMDIERWFEVETTRWVRRLECSGIGNTVKANADDSNSKRYNQKRFIVMISRRCVMTQTVTRKPSKGFVCIS
jgi:hypothetical protein